MVIASRINGLALSLDYQTSGSKQCNPPVLKQSEDKW